MATFPKWDAHHHLWTYEPATMGWIPNDRIRRDFHLAEWESTLEQAGVDGSILVQVHQTWEETLAMNLIASQSDRILGVVGWIDLLSDRLPQFWESLPLHHQIVGFRHILQAEGEAWWQQPALAKGIQTLGQHNFSYDVLLTQVQLPWAVSLASACDQTPLILDHLAKPAFGQTDRSAWEKPLRELAQMPHVAVKISGFITECPDFDASSIDFHPYFDFLLEHFGPNRLMVGSDWPVCLMGASYAEQKSRVERWMQPFSVTEKEALWHRTAQTWYGL